MVKFQEKSQFSMVKSPVLVKIPIFPGDILVTPANLRLKSPPYRDAEGIRPQAAKRQALQQHQGIGPRTCGAPDLWCFYVENVGNVRNINLMRCPNNSVG